MKDRLSRIQRFLRVHWFSALISFLGVSVVTLYVIARVRYSDLFLRTSAIYMLDVAFVALFVLTSILVIYYVERQHRVRVELSLTSEALMASEERIRNIVENTRDVIFTVDEAGKITFASPNAVTSSGYSMDEIIGRHFTDFVAEESRSVVAHQFGLLLAQDAERGSFDINVIMAGRRIVPATVRGSAIYRNGRFAGLMGMIADMSESEQMEADILRYTKALTALSEISASISYSFAIDEALDESLECTLEIVGTDSGAIYDFDDSSLQLRMRVSKGLTPECAEAVSMIDLGRTSLDGIPQVDRDRLIHGTEHLPGKIREAIADEGLEFVCAIPLVVRDRLVGTLNLSSHDPFELQERDVEMLKTVGQKISFALDNARLLSELIKSRTQLEATLESMDDPVVVMDTGGRVSYVNSRFERLFGLGRERLEGKNLFDIAWEDQERPPNVPSNREELFGVFRSRLEKGGVPFEVAVATGDSQINFNVAITNIRIDGQTNGFVCVMHDVTGYKRLDQMKSDFVSTASHQLRTPLASIVGFSETILHHFDTLDAASMKEYTGIVARQGRKLAAIVNDLLDYSRIEEGELSIERENVFLPELVSTVLLDFVGTSPDHEFLLEFAEDFPAVYVDQFKIEHVMNNLIANAVKYSPDGGRVGMGGRKIEGGVQVWVSDEGVGMSEVELENLFTRFYRAPGGRTMSSAGTGLGLYIVKMLVDAHGGRIEVESEPGGGSTFMFFLPTD